MYVPEEEEKKKEKEEVTEEKKEEEEEEEEEEEKKKTQNPNACILCLGGVIKTAALPCGHAFACLDCMMKFVFRGDPCKMCGNTLPDERPFVILYRPTDVDAQVAIQPHFFTKRTEKNSTEAQVPLVEGATRRLPNIVGLPQTQRFVYAPGTHNGYRQNRSLKHSHPELYTRLMADCVAEPNGIGRVYPMDVSEAAIAAMAASGSSMPSGRMVRRSEKRQAPDMALGEFLAREFGIQTA